MDILTILEENKGFGDIRADEAVHTAVVSAIPYI